MSRISVAARKLLLLKEFDHHVIVFDRGGIWQGTCREKHHLLLFVARCKKMVGNRGTIARLVQDIEGVADLAITYPSSHHLNRDTPVKPGDMLRALGQRQK